MSAQLFSNTKISSRVVISFLVLLFFMIVMIVTGTISLKGNQERLNAIVHENMVKIDCSQNLRFLARHEAVIIRNILLLRDTDQKMKEVGRREEAQKRYQEVEDRLSGMPLDEQSKAILSRMVDSRQATRPLWDKVVQLGMANKSEEGIRFLVSEVREVQQKWLDSLDEFEKTESRLARDSVENADRGYHRALMLFIVIGAAAVVFGAFIAFMITRSIIRPLAEFTLNVEQIAAGDQTTALACDTRNEFGALGQKINAMAESFEAMRHDMMVSANNVIKAVAILNTRAIKTSQGAQNQAGQANGIAASAEEMNQTITDIAKNASAVADSSAEAKGTAIAGQEVAAMGIKKANNMYDSTVELAARVEKLTNRVGEIGEIVTVIKGIADQTNLLALNAAIEAARAGEQGRGFSVVADEVRKLAERTIKATADISRKIGAVQEESSQTAQFMGETSAQVTELKQFISNVGGALQAIIDTVQIVSDQTSRIAAAVEEQSSASEDVAKNIETTSVIAREMEQAAGEMMLEINNLTVVAENLRDSTTRVKTKAGKLMILDLAKTDHLIFMDKIGSCLNGNGNGQLDPARLPDHRSCKFGKWYLNEGQEMYGALPGFKEIDGPHAKIHAKAKEAVSAANTGDKNTAMHLYHEMQTISGQIGNLLDQIKSEAVA